MTKETSKAPSRWHIIRLFGEAFRETRASLTQVTDSLPGIWWKAANLAQANYEAGCTLAARGALNDAIFRFRFARWLNPEMIPAHYNLGCCYLDKQQPDKARACFEQILTLKPECEEATFMLRVLDGKNITPGDVPSTLIITQFENLADSYDAYMRSVEYAVPAVMAKALTSVLAETAPRLRVLDIGCGTGLCMEAIHASTRYRVGVDITPGMVMQAREKVIPDTLDPQGQTAGSVQEAAAEGSAAAPLYHQVHQADIGEYLEDISALENRRFDLILAGHVCGYLADIGAWLAACREVLAEGGYCILTTELLDVSTEDERESENEAYQFNRGWLYFRYREAFLEKAAEAAGFSVIARERFAFFSTMPDAQPCVCLTLQRNV